MVTGSHIGAAAKFSPVLSFDRDYFDRAGITSAGQLLASLPQNFGGGVSADNVGVGSGAGPGAATVNLRGLESGGTLTLLNGRRLAPSSFSGGDIDISSIPVSAIERVEVLTDIADDVENDRNVNAVFAEAYVPIVGQANARPGVQELSLSLAGRYEDYSDIGSSFNPKFGVVWSPLAGLSLRSTYGRSFRAPNLERLRDVIDVVTLYDYIDPNLPGAETPALLVVGNSSDLDPEKSESVGVDLQPPGLSNLNVGATCYHIRYTGRIDYPRLDFRADNRLSDYSSIPIRNPSLDTLQTYVDRAGLFDNYTQMFPGHSNSELSDVTWLLLYMPLNTVATETSGIDLSMSYQLDTNLGVWTADLNANYIMQFDERTSPRSPVQSLYNRIFLPVDLRARASLSWTRGGLTTSAFVNYTDDYINDQTDDVPTRIDAWTTLDASLQYEFPDNSGASVLSGVVLTFNVLTCSTPTRREHSVRLSWAGLAGLRIFMTRPVPIRPVVASLCSCSSAGSVEGANRMTLINKAAVLAGLVTVASIAAHAEPLAKRPVTAEDLITVKVPSQVALSPDGRWVAYILTAPSLERITTRMISSSWRPMARVHRSR